MNAELTALRKELAAYLKRNPNCGHGKVVMKNLNILASDTDDDAKADVLKVPPANVERFRAARAERI